MTDTIKTENVPEFPEVLGHPKPLWMLFMTEFWERFAFYGMRWAMALYIVAQFHGGDSSGQAHASALYGAYLALVYAAALFGGYVADKIIGYQRSILLGAIFSAAGLLLIIIPDEMVFKVGLATIIVGNGLFKPNISTMVGQLYFKGDSRRDSGFTLFYMGINAGALVAPLITGYMAENMFGGTHDLPAYKAVFLAAGIGMVISTIWFWFGRSQLLNVGLPSQEQACTKRLFGVIVGMFLSIPVIFFLLEYDFILNYLLPILFIALCALLIIEGFKEGPIRRDMTFAMLIIFAFNILFWMFFEQAGSSFNFLAQDIVNREFGDWRFPVGWFQSVNSLSIITLAPVIAWIWVKMGKKNPSIPRKFGLGLIFNGLAFLLLVFALSALVDEKGMIPFWTLFAVYVIQSVGELCLSPIGLSMVTKLAPTKLIGFGMGGWFLSTAIGDHLSGVYASFVSGTDGLTVESAKYGYTLGFWMLLGAGVLLFLLAPLIQRLMHGVK